jgi:hypothetical protein
LRDAQDLLEDVPAKYAQADSYDKLNDLERTLITAANLIATAQDTAASIQRYGIIQLCRNSVSMIDRISGLGYAQWELIENVDPDKRGDAMKALASSTWPQVMIGTAMNYNTMAIGQLEELLR